MTQMVQLQVRLPQLQVHTQRVAQQLQWLRKALWLALVTHLMAGQQQSTTLQPKF